MKVRLIKSLRIEQISLRILLFTSILAFVFSVFLEIGVKEFVCQAIYQKFHINYIINIMLGISASSCISFVSLVFPYLDRKNKQIEKVVVLLNQIYEQYTELYIIISQECTKEDYSFERHILEEIGELERRISIVQLEYERAEFISDTITEINRNLKKKMLRSLSVIKVFCSHILMYEEIRKEKLVKENNIELEITKDVIMKRADSDLYKCLLEMVDSIFSIKELADIYRDILSVDNTYKYLENKILDIQNAYDEMENLNLDLGLRIKIQSKIVEIRRNHSIIYTEECERIKKSLKEVIQKLKENDIEGKEYSLNIEKIFQALNEDDLKEAEKLLEELKCEVERK